MCVFAAQIIKVTLEPEEFDSFVFCLAHKRICSTLQKDHQDLVRPISVISCWRSWPVDDRLTRPNLCVGTTDPERVIKSCLLIGQSAYCTEKKSAEKYGLSSNFQVLSENPEITQCVLDAKVSNYDLYPCQCCIRCEISFFSVISISNHFLAIEFDFDFWNLPRSDFMPHWPPGRTVWQMRLLCWGLFFCG